MRTWASLVAQSSDAIDRISSPRHFHRHCQWEGRLGRPSLGPGFSTLIPPHDTRVLWFPPVTVPRWGSDPAQHTVSLPEPQWVLDAANRRLATGGVPGRGPRHWAVWQASSAQSFIVVMRDPASCSQ